MSVTYPSTGQRRFVLAVARGGLCLGITWLGGWGGRGAEGPRIDHIERINRQQVTIHFDTEAGRGYTLQFADELCGGAKVAGGCAAWTTLFAVPAFPFPNHYVVVDDLKASHRTYRLLLTP